ncbi:MAG: hypothetical protein NUV69_01260 [Candidatus Curtissbacteria bacterium]|nr:hypothetical protein [Candidatus Curtissbacteria bacterium]
MKEKLQHTKRNNLKVNWRTVWYSVLIWLMGIIVGGFVVLPWYYLVFPLIVLWTTVVYFNSKRSEKSFRAGLWISLFWFFSICTLDFIEIIGPYYFDVPFYFSDSRNWLKYPLILLVPVIYSLVLESSRFRKPPRRVLAPKLSADI